MTIKLYDSDGKLIDRLYQWDVNRHITLSFGEIIEPVESDQIYFHFSNNHTEEAYSVKAIKNGERDYEVMIPNELFVYDDTIFMYIFRDCGANGRITIEVVKLPVTARSMPGDYVFKDSPGVIRIANGLVAVGNVVYLAKDGVPFGEGVEAAPDVGFGATGDATTILDGVNVAVVGELQPLQTQDLSGQTWVQGTGNPATGEFPSDDARETRIRCMQYFSIPDGCHRIQAKPQIISGAACLFVAYFYTDNTFISATSWTNQIEQIPDGATRYRILIRKEDNSTITPDEFASCIVDFY